MSGTDGVVTVVGQISQGISGIGTVFPYHPIFANGDEFPAAWIWVERVHEERRGYGGPAGVGPAGKKLVTHTVCMEVHQSTADAQQGESDWRQFLDNIRVTWRANQLLKDVNGVPTVERFGEDIDITLADPWRVGDMVQFRAVVTSDAWEEING